MTDKPKSPRKPRAAKKTQGNLLMEAFEAFAVARANYERAVKDTMEAREALTAAQESLSGLGIYVSLAPIGESKRPLGAEEEDAYEERRGGEAIHIPAVGPEAYRSPDEEVARIRSSSYGVGAENIDPNDASALAQAVGGTMGNIISNLTKGGGQLVVGPQMPGQPTAAGDSVENPHAKNQHGGPVEQRPV